MLPARLALAAYYEREGRHEEASRLAGEVLRINPRFTLEAARRLPSRMQVDSLGLPSELLQRAGLP